MRLRKLISDCNALAFLDPNARTMVATDALPYSLGVVLSQKVD